MSGKDYLISISSTHVKVEKETQFLKAVFWSPHMCWAIHSSHTWWYIIFEKDVETMGPGLRTSHAQSYLLPPYGSQLHVPNVRAYDPKVLQYSALCSWNKCSKSEPMLSPVSQVPFGFCLALLGFCYEGWNRGSNTGGWLTGVTA